MKTMRLIDLGALCRRQGLYEQADYIESCATKSGHDPEAINRALIILRQIRIYDDSNNHQHYQGTMRRAQQQPPPPQEYGRLRRSGSFQKLRQSIRRGSEKLVQKLRGTPTNSPSMHYSMPVASPYEPIKRASSMSVLNQVPPPNRPLPMNQSFKQSNPSIRARLASAENLH